MGSWGITERQSDNGDELLDIIVTEQLRKVDFAVFNVAEAIKLLNDDTQKEIEQYRQKPKSKSTEYYISECLMHNFTHAAVLIAECVADYYQTGELIVYDYVGENYDPVEHRIKDFTITSADLQSLLEVLETIQNPEHWFYQRWVNEETCQRWLTHIHAVAQALKDHT